MENPNKDKVAKVAEIREKFEAAEAVLITEYRGLSVSDLAELRKNMSSGGGEYKVYKNTLVRIAIADMGYEIGDQLTGPTAIAFVTNQEDGTPGDVATVAKALRDFAKDHEPLVIKGGLLGDAVLDEAGVRALASLPTASEIYSRLAGAVNSGARGMAGSVSAIHRSLALVLQATIDGGHLAEGGAASAESAAPEASADDAATEVESESSVATATADEADTAEAPAEAPAAEVAEEPVADATEEPAADAAEETEN